TAAPPRVREPPPAAADLAPVTDKLTVWTDGKKRFLAVVLSPNSDLPAFWSADGKEFYQLRVFSGGSEGDEKDLKRLDRSFWEPRVGSPYQGGFDYKAENKVGKMSIQCLERITELKQLPAAEAKTLIDGGKFFKPRWNRKAYAL